MEDFLSVISNQKKSKLSDPREFKKMKRALSKSIKLSKS